MRYLPNLLPDHSKVDLGIPYAKQSQKTVKKQSDLWLILSYIGAIGCLFSALFSFFPMPILSLLYVLIGLLLLPPIHTMLENKLRFRFTWAIKTVLMLCLFIPSIVLSGVAVNKVQNKMVVQKQQKEKEDKEQQERDKQAKIDAEKSEKSRKDSLNFYNSKANAEFKKNRYLPGIVYLNKALKFANSSDQDDIYQRRAFNYYKAGKYTEAEKDYTTLIGNSHKLSDTYYQRALCYQKQNKKKDAISDLKVAMEKGNTDAEKLYNKLNPIKKRVVGYVTRCCDGSTSSSSGRGACSHHGGVCNWNEPIYDEYREYE